MTSEDDDGSKSALRVAAEIALLILVPTVVFGLAIAQVAGSEHVVGAR